MKVQLYGRLADAFGREVDVEGPPRTVRELRDTLGTRQPDAADTLRRSRAFAGGAMVGDDEPISALGAIDLLPPVSGG